MKRFLSLILVIFLLISLIPNVFAEESLPLTDEEWGVLFLTNRARLGEGLKPLTATVFLQDACDIRAEEIVEKFSHERPDGTMCYTVLDEVSAPAFHAAGENIAAGYPSAASVVNGWLNSPGHRANIMDSEYVHIGVGYKREAGSYYGSYWVQFFHSTWQCEHTSLSLVGGTDFTFSEGTSIDDMHLTAKLTCKKCGTAYLPVMSELCSGYDPTVSSKQTVTLSCFGLETKFTVTCAKSHTHSYTAVVTAPNCTDRGYTTHTCNCGDSYVDNYVPALGHKYADGYCERCGEGDPSLDLSSGFHDIPINAWYGNAVHYAVDRGLMNGMGEGEFQPDGSTTRAMVVTILHRLSGSTSTYENPFTDVLNDNWYTDAISWAAYYGIVDGMGNNTFEPETSMTREMLAVILYRYTTSKTNADTANKADLGAYPDCGDISPWAEDAMQWAVANGIINGNETDGKTYLQPQANATRAQVAAIFQRYIENVLSK